MTMPPAHPAPPTPPALPAPLPRATRLAIFARLFAVQGSWSYERLAGTGIGFCVEPALRQMRRGADEAAYREALARESRYFNAHPYLAAIAVGALARAELERCEPARIERFRGALCSPLGSLGDRLVWAGWLPFTSLLVLLAFALGAPPLAVVVLFLVVYNVGHVALRVWGLRVGWRHGLRVATVLGHPVLRHAPLWVTRAVAVLAGAALPLAVRRIVGPAEPRLALTLGLAAVLAAASMRLPGRLAGWRLALLLTVVVAFLALGVR